jgi:DNA-binding NarL/FixJ family response regulator
MIVLEMTKPQQKQIRSDSSLTPRERDVVRLIASGLSNKSIAHRLGLREGTVKVHLHNIYQKLGISGRVELILTAIASRNE